MKEELGKQGKGNWPSEKGKKQSKCTGKKNPETRDLATLERKNRRGLLP